MAELDLRVCDSCQFCFHEPKIRKTFIFHELFFPKCNKNNQHRRYLSVSLPRVKWAKFNNERTEFHKLRGYKLKLKVIKIFFTKQYFFLNSNHVRSMNRSVTKIFLRDTNMVPQRHQISNIFGLSRGYFRSVWTAV